MRPSRCSCTAVARRAMRGAAPPRRSRATAGARSRSTCAATARATGPRASIRTGSVHFRPAARRLTVPTLLVRGRDSDILSDEGVREFLGHLPNAEYVDVGGAGHMVAGDRNDAFTEAVRGFLARAVPVGGPLA